MARDGSGNYSLPYPTFTNGTTADADQVTANNTDLATAMAGSIAADGQTPITADIPMSTHKFTGMGAGSAATDSANLGQIQAEAYVWCGTAGGTKNALTLSPTPAITAYGTGSRFRFKTGAAQSDDVVTIAISGLTTKAGQINDTALSASLFLAASKWYEAFYDGTALQLTRLSPPNPSVDYGYINIPVNPQSTAYTTVLTDQAKAIQHPSTDNNARTFTIDGSVAYPVGTAITFINRINTLTIAITTDTLTLAGAGSTGSRTLAANGMATAVKDASGTWMISGAGLS